ncbi:MAG: CxxxxCH/CxxCH domain-containing protein, partial [Deltaproteobacteria bacterium]|nr:CxxxxCH/CxxCH domain-containing protein [Deltaproteobacteria bacterium]
KSGSYHPSGWTDPKSGNFHGDATKKGLGMCKDCHGAALDGGSAGVSCNSCHSGWKTNCTFCHGGKDNNLGAPPVDTKDQFDTTHTSVGAHTSHVTAKSKLSSPLDCVKCHVKPVDALSDGHIDPSPAEVDFAAWNHDTAICSNLYCHGNFVGGNNANAPKWTVVNGTKAACGTCHDLPPKTGKHPSNFGKHSFMGKNCSNCHNGFANDGATQILQPDKHLNGAKDVSIKNGTWTASTKTCDPACHGAEKW